MFWRPLDKHIWHKIFALNIHAILQVTKPLFVATDSHYACDYEIIEKDINGAVVFHC
tara:strand:- start:367 stop:537 length:171 start_codon:yes stop_codon:yes gene_type:complete